MKWAVRSIHRFHKAFCNMKSTETASEEAKHISHKLMFYINGRKVEDEAIDPNWTLLYYIRNKLHLHGTRMGCSEGGCGCCTVMISRYDHIKQKAIHYPMSCCLAPICSIHRLAVTTVEGVGSTKSNIHPVQERIAKAHGMQCGYCSPGFVMSMYSLLRQDPIPQMNSITEAFQGNLCRCTGYRPILEGFRTFSKEWLETHQKEPLDIYQIQKEQFKTPDKCVRSIDRTHEERLFKPEEFTPYDACREPDFPEELKVLHQNEYLHIKGPETTWLRPTTLKQLISIKNEHPAAKIIAGNTIVRFEIRTGKTVYPIMVSVKYVQEMMGMVVTETGLKIGAAVSVDQIRNFLQEQIRDHPVEKTKLFKEINDLMHWIASKQVRSVCTMGGNIMVSNPSSDLLPILLTSRVLLEVYDGKEIALVSLDEDFVRSRKAALHASEILVAIHLPFSKKNQYFKSYKHSKRREVDVSLTNFAVKVEFEDESNIISSIFFGIGGVSDKPIEAPKTQEKLKGLPWDKTTLEKTYTYLLEDLLLNLESGGEYIRYRRCLVLGLFLKSYLAISKELRSNLGDFLECLFENDELSGISKFEKKEFTSSQHFPVAPDNQSPYDAVQTPMVRPSSHHDACGEAIFLNDMPKYTNELSLAYIWSSSAHANIVTIDPSAALKIEGVHAFLSDKDISEDMNQTGTIIKGDEYIFYSKKVTSQGQIIGAILADSNLIAHKAARLVKVQYENLDPLVLTIEDAIKHDSFFHEFESGMCYGGEVDKILENAPHTIKGSCRIGNQKHLYMETQRCLVVPGQDGGLEIYSSTQSPSHLAKKASEIGNISENKIKVHVKRLGSAVGAKSWKSIVIAQPVILAAKLFQRPIRCILDREEDMVMIGGRIPHLFTYTVGFDDQGKILACDFDIYANCGYSLGANHLIIRNVLHHLDNAFSIPAIRAKTKLCKTNIPSNPLMKGCGAPEGQFPITHILEGIAEYLEKDLTEIHEINLYKNDSFTFYGQKLENFNLQTCWDECIANSKYWKRKAEINTFNSQNKYKKRGISIVPTKMGFGIEQMPRPFFRAAALINVYKDGSVLLYIGGVEMGQGLYTKMVQIATRALNIPASKIHIEETATNMVPNCANTIGSIDINLYGAAVFDACERISERICQYREAHPNGTWEDWIMEAYVDNVNLSATGIFKRDPEGTHKDTNNIFEYFVCGAACSMVEIDTLTGDHQILTADIVVDLGNSLNPAIDIGQIEGGFMQGYGLFIMEETLYSPTGTLFTKGPVSYKIPGFGDIPENFNVSLLKGTAETGVLFPAKSADEASQILASSVYYAIKEAIKATRCENAAPTAFNLTTPATAATIRLACVDPILKKVAKLDANFKPWTVIV